MGDLIKLVLLVCFFNILIYTITLFTNMTFEKAGVVMLIGIASSLMIDMAKKSEVAKKHED